MKPHIIVLHLFIVTGISYGLGLIGNPTAVWFWRDLLNIL